MKVVLVGHSHSNAIVAALGTPGDPALSNIAACSIEHVYLRKEPFHGPLRDAQARLTDCGLSLSQRLKAADAAVLSLEGGWHDFAMVERRHRFDFFGDPGEALIEEGRQLIPRRLMARILTDRMESVMKSADETLRPSFPDALMFICEHLTCPAVLLETPPPVPDAGKITKYRPIAAMEKRGVTPLPIRRKLWRLQCSLMRQYCDRAGIDYLPVPNEVFDTNGALDPRAYEGVDDCTHMGPWYGRCVLRQIDAWLGRQIAAG